MRQALCCLVGALLLGPAPAAADEQKEPAIPVKKLILHPAQAPVPALKYRLMPELRDLKPGNAITSYYRAFSPDWQAAVREKDFWAWVEKWDNDKSKPPPKELEFARNFNALVELDIGARRAYCDWEMTDRLRKDGIMLLIPDIQGFRTFGILLAARARFEMLDGQYDKSLFTLQTGFTMSRHVSDGPTLIQALVGGALAHQMVEEIEQLIQRPGAPNLYWTLTDLPTPFIDLRKSIQGERIVIDSLFPGARGALADREALPSLSTDPGKSMLRTFELLEGGNGKANRWEVKPAVALIVARSYPEARKFLLDQGRDKKLVDEMLVTQVAMLYEVHNYDRLYDEMSKWYGQPYPVMLKGVAQAVTQLREARANMSAGTLVATLLLPAVQKVFHASYRVDRKLAGLRCVEAIRLYAASHDGKLPASLKDIEEVPVPLDPYTGQAFEYKADAKGAVLTAPITPGQSPVESWSFAITMQPMPKRSNP